MLHDCVPYTWSTSSQWRHNGRDSVSNHQPHDCLLNRLFRHSSMKTSKLRVTGLCAGNSPGTGEFPAQMASYEEYVSIWWRHHDQRQAKAPHHSPIARGSHQSPVVSLYKGPVMRKMLPSHKVNMACFLGHYTARSGQWHDECFVP